MRLVIDYKKCRKAGQCSYLHPELFKADEAGAPVVLLGHLGEDLREAQKKRSTFVQMARFSLKKTGSSILHRVI